MNKIITLIILTILISLSGCNSYKLTGTLFVSGNEPFTFLAIATDDYNNTVYKIECEESLKNELWSLQGKTVDLYYDEIKKYERLNIAIINRYSVKDFENEEK